jgi:hypothetical protein
MHSAHSRPLAARRQVTVLALAMSVMVIASLAGATSAFAWNTSTYNCIALTPATADNQLPQDSTHTVTATVTGTVPDERTAQVVDPCSDPQAALEPKAGATVYFVITSGPNAGVKGTAVTDANGKATFSWTSNVSGTDKIEAYTSKEIDAQGNPLFIEGDPVYGQGDIAWASAVKNWLPPLTPNPPVTPAGVPDTNLVVSNKCQSKKFKISSTHSNGTVTSYTLQVDGKTVKTVSGDGSTSGSKSFTIVSGNYTAGSHSIKLTTTFSDGSKVVKTGKFKRCAIRTSKRRVSPNFTG